MRRWFLSYNSQDFALAEALEAGLRRKDPQAGIFFAPASLRPGAYWMPALTREIAAATGFVLLVGKGGLGPWQTLEYYEACDRRVKQHDFPVVLVLLDGQPAPGLPFLRQLHWIVTADPAAEKTVAQLLDAMEGDGAMPGELWRHAAPYRGLGEHAKVWVGNSWRPPRPVSGMSREVAIWYGCPTLWHAPTKEGL